jgi:flavin-dependent dehydrogenase
LIAANGSWERSAFENPRGRARASDLFAFKARFANARLPAGLMPLLAFPAGYGGMVTTDSGLVSLSCCIRRDVLAACRLRHVARHAGESVLRHIFEHCAPVREALDPASLDGRWFAAGPIRPGIRLTHADGIFRLGNAAGEAHPVIAEGIAMALLSAQLLCGILIRDQDRLASRAEAERAAKAYAAAWRQAFALRIRAAALFARLAMSPRAAALVPLIGTFPRVLSLGAQLSGKTRIAA